MNVFSAALASGTAARDYFRHLGMPPDTILLGYDVVDNGYFAAQAAQNRNREAEVRNRYGLPERYFLASARFVEKKNLPRLMEAYALYRRKCRAQASKCELWDLVLLGDGPLRGEIEARVAALGIRSWVHLPGFQQYGELPLYYGLASAFVHASSVEQWGLVVNEAMASGLPVLVSKRCGCAQDLVEDGRNGFLIDPFDVDCMGEKMLRMTQLPSQERQTMGRRSQEIIAAWGPERFAQGLKAAADKAMEIGPARASVIEGLLLKAMILGS